MWQKTALWSWSLTTPNWRSSMPTASSVCGTDDTRPFEPDDTKLAPPIHKNMGRSSMSWLTSLALSFNNLRTKKARTLLTAFAGSIGIIGIALIISLSTGVNAYIADMERSTLSE